MKWSVGLALGLLLLLAFAVLAGAAPAWVFAAAVPVGTFTA